MMFFVHLNLPMVLKTAGANIEQWLWRFFVKDSYSSSPGISYSEYIQKQIKEEKMPKSKDTKLLTQDKGDRLATPTAPKDYTKDREQWLSGVTVEEIFGDRGLIN
jgi:hypothetical protein